MRGWFLLVMVCLSCGKTALPKGAVDAAADVASTGGASANDAPVQDAWLAPDKIASSPDLAATPDFRPDSAAGCSSLSVAWLPTPPVASCPPSSEPAACAGSDVGVVVARSEVCIGAWGAIPFQCMGWDALAADEELGVLDVPNCLDSIQIDSARACADHIELAYTINGSCQACDGTHSIWRAFLLPRDPRPIIATGRTVIPPCPPPPPDTGGTTGAGGATGAGGIAGTGGAVGSGGTTGGAAIDGGCPQTRIDSTQAAAAYTAYVGLASSATIQAVEETVPGLWEEMHAQLFNAKRYFDGGTPPTECSFIYRDCVLTIPENDCTMFGPIASGVATSGAFYYSRGWGSGIYRTNFCKLAPSGPALVKTTSGGYTNSGYGPPPLVVALDAGQILVYRPAAFPFDFNQWQGGDLVGTLKDLGNRLAIVDSSGQEIPAEFP